MSGTLQPAQTGAMTISAGTATVAPVSFGYYPPEGSRAVGCVYDWTSVTQYLEDLSSLSARGIETTIQAVFIDNSSCANPVTLTVPATQQVLVCPANSQGAFPLFLTGAPLVSVVTTGTSASRTRVTYLNVPLGSVSQWGVVAASGGYTGPPSVAPGTSPTGINGGLSEGVSTVAAPTYSNNTVQPLSIDGSGSLRVNTGLYLPQGITTAGVGGMLNLAGAVNSPQAYTAGTTNALLTDLRGGLLVNMDGREASYSYAGFITLATTPTDVFSLQGSASKLVKLRSVDISFYAGSGAQIAVDFFRRTSANTGGSTSGGPGVRHLTADGAATAVSQFYTSNPSSLGGNGGAFASFFIGDPTNSGQPLSWPFGGNFGLQEPFTLNGTSEFFCINLEGASIPTGTVMRLSVHWTEA